jgi:hypothetical protein
MTYVEPAANHGWSMRGRNVKNCHLVADTLEELHAMAKAIGMKREWFQDGRIPHYDLTETRRAAAVKRGTRELTRREFSDLVFKKVKPCPKTK